MQQLLSESVSERKRIAKEGGLRHTKQRKRVVFFSGGAGGRISSISASAASSIICRSWLVPSRFSMLLDYLADALALFCWFRLLTAYGGSLPCSLLLPVEVAAPPRHSRRP